MISPFNIGKVLGQFTLGFSHAHPPPKKKKNKSHKLQASADKANRVLVAIDLGRHGRSLLEHDEQSWSNSCGLYNRVKFPKSFRASSYYYKDMNKLTFMLITQNHWPPEYMIAVQQKMMASGRIVLYSHPETYSASFDGTQRPV